MINAERIRTQIKAELEALKPPSPLYVGAASSTVFTSTQDFSRKISQIYLQEFLKDPRFLKADPVLLGSWARDQMTPKSDLDLGFWSDSKETHALIEDLQKLRLPMRARILTPEDIAGWPSPEQMAFLEFQGLTGLATQKSEIQKQKLINAPKAILRKQVKELMHERDHRRSQGYQFENVLEPHLKTGRGGLRDIQQAFHLLTLYPQLWPDQHLRDLMVSSLWFLLTVRVFAHKLGAGDFLQAALQPEIAREMGYKDFREFMREVQKALSRVAFYTDFMFEWALSSPQKRAQYESVKFNSASDCLKSLRKDPSLSMQYRVRREMDPLITAKWISKNQDEIDSFQSYVFSKSAPENLLRASFRSRLLDKIDPRLRHLVGYNQHDQYHAFTAETHILNLLLGLKNALNKPRSQGLFAGFIKELSARDEQVLAWTCYYHDLAKGQGGDHEQVGEQWVKQDGQRFQRPEAVTEEVAWLVRNHLEFSKAAFREDPRSEKTWQRLFDLDLNPGRIRRLMLFTVLDIQATHPKAWTPWKEKLLFELAMNLLAPARLKTIQASRKIAHEFSLPEFDLSFLESVTAKRVSADLRRVLGFKSVQGFRVEKVRGGFWVRYFDKRDQPGVLVQALKSIFSAGASVQEAWVFSVKGIGVYDWFFVESGLRQESFERRLALMDPKALGESSKGKTLSWSEVSIEKAPSQAPRSANWVLHLQGQDQRGLLVWTAEEIAHLGGNILSARIQTWGERAEDRLEVSFHEASPDLDARLIQSLKGCP